MATTTQSNAVRQLSDGNSQGTQLGLGNSTDAISFFGMAPTVQKAIIGSNTLSTAVSSTGAFGFGDATTASTVIAAIKELQAKGLIR